MNRPRFLSPEQARTIADLAGTPVYVYSEAILREQIARIRSFPNAFGLTCRFAMKACPNRAILGILRDEGFQIDASSIHEVYRALRAGFAPGEISLSSQELPADLSGPFAEGLKVNACSLDQLDRYGRAYPGNAVGLRFNPGLGSGGTAKTNVGGPSSSFGIWKEWTGEVREILDRHGLKAVRIHSHIGSGSDPEVWKRTAGMTLDLVRQFPDVETVNLGGGYKVARMESETETDPAVVGVPVREGFAAFAAETGRRLHLEVEPGTFLVANAGAVLCRVTDVVSTGPEGYCFLKVDSGMTEILRPSLYAAQHPISIMGDNLGERTVVRAVVVGHCCESGDLLTPQPEDAEGLAEREFPDPVRGDLCVIDGAGAYCAAMTTKNYNSFPEAPEVLLQSDGTPRLIRRRQTLDQLLANEC